MAAPTTHAIISWAILRVYLCKKGLQLYSFEGMVAGFCAFFFGVAFDFFDHFLGAPESFKKDLKVRLKRMLKFQSAPPSKGVEFPVGWLHGWLGLFLILVSGFVLYSLFPHSILFVLPFVFWFVHVAIDKLQRNDETAPYNYSFWYPINKKKYSQKWGYPIKSQAEIGVSLALCAVIAFYEIGYFLDFLF